jgi:copper homeostasis protein (lipoprotein)
MYQSMARSGLFTECSTGLRWPVASDGDIAALQAAYSKARSEPNQQLLVSIQGQVAMRPNMEGSGIQAAVIAEKFINIWPGQSCGAKAMTPSLTNTHWKLTQLNGEPVTADAVQREAYIELQGDPQRVSGSGGCNRLTGTYTLNGDSITFSKVAATMMACPKGMDTEQHFIRTLDTAKSWKIIGRLLELDDADGTLVARFEASGDK